MVLYIDIHVKADIYTCFICIDLALSHLLLSCTDFHPRILGLTGTQSQVDAATKVYRIYHSKSAKDDDNDYLVR